VPDSPNILCIAGSPRSGGNSEILLDEAVAGIEAQGGTAVRLHADESLGVLPCRACRACSATGSCIREDGMSAVYELIDAADGFVVASPVFFAGVPSTLKALFDRLQPYWARRFVLGEPRPATRPGAALVVGGGGDPYGSGCAVTEIRSALGVLGVAVEDVLEVVGPDERGTVRAFAEEMSRARDIGARVASRAAELQRSAGTGG